AAIAAARALLGREALVGASCYDDPARARDAAAAGAGYLAFGALFPSATKPNARHAMPDLLRAAAIHGLPLVAIGGITPENAGIAIAAGADLVAVVGGVFDAPDPLRAARALQALFS
ncbi:MAG: thiamine phosphate synthase, partial [Luteimonas sp.]